MEGTDGMFKKTKKPFGVGFASGVCVGVSMCLLSSCSTGADSEFSLDETLGVLFKVVGGIFGSVADGVYDGCMAVPLCNPDEVSEDPPADAVRPEAGLPPG